MYIRLRGYPEFMTERWQVIDIYEGYVLSFDEIDDDEGFVKHWYQATSNTGECVFEDELKHFTYQSNHAFVIDEFRRLVLRDLK